MSTTKTQPVDRRVRDFPYEPETWSDAQLAAHRASTLEEAFHQASCLAGGWYRHAVAIDWQVSDDNNERYMLRPAEVLVADGWHAAYEVKSIGE